MEGRKSPIGESDPNIKDDAKTSPTVEQLFTMTSIVNQPTSKKENKQLSCTREIQETQISSPYSIPTEKSIDMENDEDETIIYARKENQQSKDTINEDVKQSIQELGCSNESLYDSDFYIYTDTLKRDENKKANQNPTASVQQYSNDDLNEIRESNYEIETGNTLDHGTSLSTSFKVAHRPPRSLPPLKNPPQVETEKLTRKRSFRKTNKKVT